MRNNSINRWVMQSSAVLLLMIVLLYVFNPELAISINRSLEMMKSGSAKGLMMIWYQYDDLAFLMAGLSWVMQLMSGIFNNSSVASACYGLFDGFSAKTILTLFGLVAMMCSYAVGLGIRFLIERVFRKAFNAYVQNYSVNKRLRQGSEIGLIVMCFWFIGLNWSYAGVLFYGFGVAGIDFRKAAAAPLIGFLLFY